MRIPFVRLKLSRSTAALLCKLGCLAVVWTAQAERSMAQIVQLPNHRSFSLHGSVQVPDRGEASLGGVESAGDYSNQRPGTVASSRTRGASGASVHATVIDLDELDKMIRSQVEDKPKRLRLAEQENPNTTRQLPITRKSYTVKDTPASYDYMIAMSHGAEMATQISPQGNLENARHYLQFADRATRRKEWSTASYFYNLAWENLPESRRTQAMKDLLDARAARIAASKEIATQKVAKPPR